MRFMMMVKTAERSGPPPKELMDAMDKLAEEAIKAGEMIDSGGLGPTAAGSRVRLTGGKITVTDGPFTEAKEVVGGFAILQANSKEEAIQLAKNFLKEVGDGECELRQLFGEGRDSCADVAAGAKSQSA